LLVYTRYNKLLIEVFKHLLYCLQLSVVVNKVFAINLFKARLLNVESDKQHCYKKIFKTISLFASNISLKLCSILCELFIALAIKSKDF